MAAPTDYFVDPSLGSDTGDGTVGNPWGRASGSVIQYALNTITRNATSGDRINVKAGTADTLAAALTMATYGVTAVSAKLHIEGYTSAAGDGGIAEINCNNFSLFTTDYHYTALKNLKIRGSGTARLVFLNDYCSMIGCELHNSGHVTDPCYFDIGAVIERCSFHDFSAVGLRVGTNSFVSQCHFFDDGTREMTKGIVAVTGSKLLRNTMVLNKNSVIGIDNTGSHQNILMHNSILAKNASTGTGILFSGSSGFTPNICMYNLVEGFSGTGGKGIATSALTGDMSIVAKNGARNNATNFDIGDSQHAEDNESLGATPFAKSGGETYSNRAVYFAPQNVGNVLAEALSKGAIQQAGGSSSTTIFKRAGMHMRY